LKHISGATLFQSLRTVNGVVHDTFKDACVALELCEDDMQWFACMNEAAAIMTGRGLRHIFYNILWLTVNQRNQLIYLMPFGRTYV